MKYFLCGIGGSGMKPLSYLLARKGHVVCGSDRVFSDAQTPYCEKLREQFSSVGIEIFAQDGSGINGDVDALVVSGAIEESNPDIKAAREFGVDILKRAQVLSEISNSFEHSICVAGTSGKTTTTGMITHILASCGKDPSFALGAELNGFEKISAPGFASAGVGKGSIFAVETDESDGTVVLFKPFIGVINNISKDHKELDELYELFNRFADNTSSVLLLNADDEHTQKAAITHKNVVTFGFGANAAVRGVDFVQDGFESHFKVDGVSFCLPMPGLHNVCNALAAIGVCKSLGLGLEEISCALKDFGGVSRRLSRISAFGSPVSVFDDFAHNPHKIQATLDTLTKTCPRLVVVYQPHGYGPVRFLLNEYTQAFSSSLRPADALFMLKIFDAGGTADRSVSAAMLAEGIKANGVDCSYVDDRCDVPQKVAACVGPGDVVVVMGARDPHLPDLARDIDQAVRTQLGAGVDF